MRVVSVVALLQVLFIIACDALTLQKPPQEKMGFRPRNFGGKSRSPALTKRLHQTSIRGPWQELSFSSKQVIPASVAEAKAAPVQNMEDPVELEEEHENHLLDPVAIWASKVLINGTQANALGGNISFHDVIVTRYRDEEFVDEHMRLKVSKIRAANFQSRSIFVIGSSLDRNLVQYACASAGSHMKQDRKFNQAYSCHLDGINLATIINYGTGEPPYWKCISGPDCKPHSFKGHSTSEEHIRFDTTAYAQIVFGGPPSIVVVESSLWDLANWWVRAGQPRNPGVPQEKITHWCHEGVPELLRWVSAAFPQSKIVFRTPPTMNHPQFGRSPDALNAMSNCIKAELQGEQYDIIDFHAIVDEMIASGKKHIFHDATHPGVAPTLMYFNELLNYAVGHR